MTHSPEWKGCKTIAVYSRFWENISHKMGHRKFAGVVYNTTHKLAVCHIPTL